LSKLGIVGRVRSRDDKAGIISADFEYTMYDRLTLRNVNECVVHPMFYTKLYTTFNEKMIVYPFPDHEDYNHIR
jgi:hypothetical protein